MWKTLVSGNAQSRKQANASKTALGFSPGNRVPVAENSVSTPHSVRHMYHNCSRKLDQYL